MKANSADKSKNNSLNNLGVSNLYLNHSLLFQAITLVNNSSNLYNWFHIYFLLIMFKFLVGINMMIL